MTNPILAEYVAAGWALVPIPVGQKGPLSQGWNLAAKCVTDPDVAAELDGNVGLAHAYSGTCVLDIDNFDEASAWLSQRGVSLQTLWTAPDAVRISSGRPNRGKLLYRVAQPLLSRKVVRDKQNIIDFRCASRNGTTVQDVLPPSIHPDTGKPYTWQYGDDVIGHWSQPPELPAEVLAVWQALLPVETAPPAPTLKPEPVERSANLGAARALLYRRDADCDRATWVQVGMMLHHESQGGLDGLELWNEWSATGTKYKGRSELETVWRSFHGTENPITIASLRIDEAADPEEFGIVTDEIVAAARAEGNAPVVPANLTEVMNALHRDKTGKALSILPNILPIIALPDICGQQLAYDEFRDGLMCAPRQTSQWRPIKDTDYTAFRVWLENAANFYPVSKDMVRDAIYYIAEGNKMDSAQIWLKSLVWDGKPRIRDFMPVYMGTIATDYERAVGEYLWTALAGRVMEPGCQADMAIILVGDQGVGKSRGVQAMVPDTASYVELRLDEPDDTIARKLRGALVAEIAELRGFGNTGMLERIKAFMTRTHERWIPKYQEFATEFARRAICIGTTNQDEFLTDIENRRWLPVRTAGVDVEGIKRDREQLWAEGLQLWMEHGVFWRNAQTLAKEHQEEYKVVDNWFDVVERWLNDHEGDEPLRIHDVLVQAVGLDVRQVTRAQELRVAALLKGMGYVRKHVRMPDKKVIRAWVKE